MMKFLQNLQRYFWGFGYEKYHQEDLLVPPLLSRYIFRPEGFELLTMVDIEQYEERELVLR